MVPQHRRLRILLVSLLLVPFEDIRTHGCSDFTNEATCLISHEISHCNMNRIVFIVDDNYHHETQTVLELFTAYSMEFTYYDVNKASQLQLEEMIENNTDKQMYRPTSFILMTSRFQDVLDATEHYFHTKGRRRGSIIPHSTKWMVFLKTLDQMDTLSGQQCNSTFDHVAAVHLDANMSLSQVFTFMWRAGRVRTPDAVKTSRLYDNSHSCFLFPNVKYGLNGRNLITLTKVHWGFFVAIRNNSETGLLEYHGFMFDIINVIMAAMNSTYVVLPRPSDNQVEWDDYAHMIEDGDVDLGITTWAFSWGDVYNISFTSPVLMDTFTGIYRRHLPGIEFNSFFIVCPFSPMTYVLLTASCAYTSFLYVFIVGFVYPHERVEKFRPLGMFSVDKKKQIGTGIPRNSLFKALVVRLRRTAWTFIASIINQAYLPRPRQMSARILIFLWSLAIVMFYAIYTGSLTAEMVARPTEAPFKSFEEMIGRGDYRWGTIDNSAIHKVMKYSKGRVIGILNRSAINIPDAKLGDIYDTLTYLLDDLEEDYVFIHFHSLLNQIRAVSKYPGHFNLITDSLFSANQAFICPLQSEVCDLLSSPINKLHESGLLNLLYDTYSDGNGTTVEEMEEVERGRRRNITLEDMRWPFSIVTVVLMISITVLVAEKAIVLIFHSDVFENNTTCIAHD